MADDLDERIAAAMRAHYLNTASEEQTADGGLPCVCGGWWEGSIEEPDDCDWAAHLAEVAAGVVRAEADPPFTPGGPLLQLMDRIWDWCSDPGGQPARTADQRARGIWRLVRAEIDAYEARLKELAAERDAAVAALADHATCALCGHERHQHGYEPILRHDWCRGCNNTTTDDLHTFKPEENP